jgi:hypothetical protein
MFRAWPLFEIAPMIEPEDRRGSRAPEHPLTEVEDESCPPAMFSA